MALVVAIAAICTPFAYAAGDALTCPATATEATGDARTSPPDAPFTRPEATVPPSKRTTRGLYLTAADAWEMVNEDPTKVLFVDVRTRGELQFIGMPTVIDAHVPILVDATPPQWDDATSSFKLVPNPDFVAAVDRRLTAKRLTRDAVVIVICQGGVRAARAADALAHGGYTMAYSVIDGFEGDPVADGPMKGQRLVNGWRNAGLPWTTKLDRVKMYELN